MGGEVFFGGWSGPGRRRGSDGGEPASAEGESSADDGAGHFKKSGRVLCEGADVKFRFIQEHLQEYPVEMACFVLEVSRSGYYAWRDRPLCSHDVRREQLARKITVLH